MSNEDMVNGQTIVISNETDGAGEVGRNKIATMTTNADYNLLTFNSGDLMPMVTNTANRSSNFRILAIMAVDKQLLFSCGTATGKTDYAEAGGDLTDFAAAIEAAKNGTYVVIGGSKGDDIATYDALLEELGLTVLAVKPEDQDKLYGAIDLLAQATNTVARGEELKSAIEDNLLNLHEAIGDAEAPTVYMAGNSSVLQTAGPAMYQNYMIENAGGLNAAASVEDTYWAEVSYEQVLDWDPDYIILASDADYDVDSVLNDAALADCTAVREGHVYQLPHAIEAVDSPVPGSFLGSVYLGSVLHPEQVSEQFYHDCADTFYTTYYGFTPASYE